MFSQGIKKTFIMQDSFCKIVLMDNLLQNDNQALITVNGLNVRSKSTDLIGPIDLAIKQGELLALIGVSGSGKSLLAKSFIGVNSFADLNESYDLYSWKAEALLNNSADTSSLEKLRGKSIFYLFQDSYLSLSPSRKIRSVFHDFAERHQLNVTEEDLIELFESLKIQEPDKLLDRYPFQVSGGQLQRLMLGMGILSSADLIIADEPTTALDAPLKREVLDLLTSTVRASNKSLLLISHNLELVRSYVDRCAILKEGRLIHDCLPAELEKSGQAYVDLLLDRSKKLQDLNKLELGQATEEILLSVENLSVKYYTKKFLKKIVDTHSVKDVSFKLRRGEALGVVGRSGSGKSSLAKALSGLVSFESTRVAIQEDELSSGQIYNQIKLIFQNPLSSLNPALSIREQLEEALLLGGTSKQELSKGLVELIEKVSLDQSLLDSYPGEVSGGQGQRAAIARALATKPKLLICDECLSSLDVVLKIEILDLLQSLVKDGISILFISHELGAVGRLCSRIAYFDEGHLVELSDRDTFFSKPKSEGLKSFIAAY